jgi:hypothetical protein
MRNTQDSPKEFPTKLLQQYPELVHFNLDLHLDGFGNDSCHVQTPTTKTQEPSEQASIDRAQAAELMTIDQQVLLSNPTLEDFSCHTLHIQDDDSSALDGSMLSPYESPIYLPHRIMPRQKLSDLSRKRVEEKSLEISHHVEPGLTKDPAYSAKVSSATPSSIENGQSSTGFQEINLRESREKEAMTFEDNSIGDGDIAEPSLIRSPVEKLQTSIDDLTASFSLLSYQDSGTRSRKADENGSNGVSTQEWASQQTGDSPLPRKRNRDESGNANNNDNGRGGDKKKKSTSGDSSSDQERLFACPFYQRNPHKHQKARICAGPGWESIYRVK